jgi:hypothetical protein
MTLGPGSVAFAILLSILAASIAGRRGSALRRWLVSIGTFAAALVPIEGIPIAGYLHGVASDLSVTTLVLCIAGLVARVSGVGGVDRRELSVLLALVLAGAAVLYPMSLGLTRYDPYRLGFRSEGFLLALLILALAAWLFRNRLVLAVVCAGVVAFSLELGESQNLWDYLIDPLLSVFAAVWIVRGLRSSAPLSKSR